MPPEKAKEWFRHMHEAAEHPERTEELAHEPRVKTTHETKKERKQPSLDRIREWERTHEK